MPTFRVRTGEVLAHAGKVIEAGEVIELPRDVASDPAVRGAIDEVDASGKPVAPVPIDDLERFRTHERVSMLRDRLVEAQSRVSAIQSQLDAEEQRLADQVKAASVDAKAPADTPVPAKRPSGKDTPTPAASNSPTT